ncbi:hypothetical protein GCM10010358_24790 [Streptomyces minutiscleroticus]|uniref:Uncharacterized protein n=1 Tax=Streptomyces minutiscleroticus TaxID=68238 RepID=A0A918KMX6_9ACTN|nr:hypothetical protein GCM10010358_24790 [Streptomyces minutiscleroticus]
MEGMADADPAVAVGVISSCNARRLHSVCGFTGPIYCERDYRATLAEGPAA